MKRAVIACLGALIAAAILGAQAPDAQKLDPKRHASAMKVIDRHLKAAGGAKALREIRSLIVKGAQSMVLFDPTDSATYYLKQPDRLKVVSGVDSILYCGDKRLFNAGTGETPLPPESLRELEFVVPLMADAYSLIHWEHAFDKAEFLGKKRYGPAEFYVVSLPGAQNGEDVTAHFDTKTYLLDRVVFKVPHPKAKFTTSVIRYKDYQAFDGIQMPTTIYFETVGWKQMDQQMKIQHVQVNPEISDAVYQDAKLDFGAVTKDGAKVKGEVRATRYDILHSNISEEHLGWIGIGDGDWVSLTVGASSVKARYLKSINPNEVPATNILCKHPRAQWPRLLLVSPQGAELKESFPYQEGDTVVIEKTEPDEQPKGE